MILNYNKFLNIINMQKLKLFLKLITKFQCSNIKPIENRKFIIYSLYTLNFK